MTALYLGEICPYLNVDCGVCSIINHMPLNINDGGGWWAWEPQAATAAIAGGLASGLAAAVIFGLGVYVERYRTKRLNTLKQAEAAISAVFKLRTWMDVGVKSGKHVLGSLKNKDSEENTLFRYVFPFFGMPVPEPLKLEDLAFLVSIDEINLLQNLLELQDWANTMRSAILEFSRMRTDWDAWVPLNSKSLPLDNGAITSVFVGEAHIEAHIRSSKMDSLLGQIINLSQHEDFFMEKVSAYIEVCKRHFKGDFPQTVQFKLEKDQKKKEDS